MTQDSYLAHYGVKGMKWGVRKKEKLVKEISQNYNGGIDEDALDQILNRFEGEKRAAKEANKALLKKRITDAFNKIKSVKSLPSSILDKGKNWLKKNITTSRTITKIHNSQLPDSRKMQKQIETAVKYRMKK